MCEKPLLRLSVIPNIRGTPSDESSNSHDRHSRSPSQPPASAPAATLQHHFGALDNVRFPIEARQQTTHSKKFVCPEKNLSLSDSKEIQINKKSKESDRVKAKRQRLRASTQLTYTRTPYVMSNRQDRFDDIRRQNKDRQRGYSIEKSSSPSPFSSREAAGDSERIRKGDCFFFSRNQKKFLV